MEDEATVTRPRRCRVAVLAGALALVLGGSAQGQDRGGPSSGRGWIWGGGISGGWIGFPGGEDAALAVGEVTGGFIVAGESFETRTGELVNASEASADEAASLVPLPSREPSGGFSFHGGYAFSPRVALLLQAELVAGVESGFSAAQGGLVLRVRPTSRLWIEGGPASGDLTYGGEGHVVEHFTGTGYGVRAGVGFTVIRWPQWDLDLEGRFGTLLFDGFRVTSVTMGLRASSRR